MGESRDLKEEKVTSLGHWFSPKPRCLQLVTRADFLHLLTWDVIFQQEKHFIYSCTKTGVRSCTNHSSASSHLSSTPANACSPPDIMSLGCWETKCWLAGWWVIQMCPKKCLVMWPDEKGCTAGASAGQDWFVMLFVLCLLILCFPLLPLSPSIKRFGMLKFTPHCPARLQGLPPCNSSLILHFYFPNIHLRVLSFFRSSIL